MKCADMRIVLTGATGGIGRELAHILVARGAAVLLVARDEQRLQALTTELGPRTAYVATDLAAADAPDRIAEAASAHFGGDANVLINNAGTSRFGPFAAESAHDVQASLATNVVAPMLLTQHLLAQFRRQAEAIVLNVGSILGSIGLPGQVCYATSKFALHGFSEALRRELQGSPVRVLYAAPRATDTTMNSAALRRLNEETGVHMDAPGFVAEQLADQLEAGRRERFFGWPERLFVKLNALFPSLVDRGARKSARLVRDIHSPTQLSTSHGANT